ncbi:MAG: DUF308 domain-containing protein [Clostridia bacterium]|nr:DUF308 domain-containing protein [Clostridia bacterium]
MKTNKGNLISWLILLVLGLMLIVGRNIVKDALYIIFAAGLIISAAAGIFGWWKEKKKSRDAIVNLLGCLCLLGIGIWILTRPSEFDTFLNVLIGLVLMVTGVQWLIRGLRGERDTLMIVLGAISLILGLIIACSSAATSWAVIAEGVGLIYAAVTGFIAEKRFAR